MSVFVHVLPGAGNPEMGDVGEGLSRCRMRPAPLTRDLRERDSLGALLEHLAGLCDELRRLGVGVVTGVFGARMQVELVNDGPVTIALDV